jgi:glutathione S-transferase
VSPSAGESLRLERAFAAPPEDVFDAWTDPEVLRRWWAARPTWTSPGCEVDLRVGGRYVLRMQDDETGEVHAVGGVYREVERPRRLVYTWGWEGAGSLHPGHESLVTVDFVPSDEGTTVVLEHSGLASEESRARHSAGWTGTLDNLADRVFGNGD